MNLENKFILDACCGGRAFWFNKHHPNALYIDKRIMKRQIVGQNEHERYRECDPDMVMDFTNLQFNDETFNLVVFDPPHLFVGENSFMSRIYGRLERDTWKNELSAGFSECFRVLKYQGILVFKWNECDIPLKEILALTSEQPLFGHHSGKASKTHWICFMKLKKDGE